ncbi:hypothetical protein Mgra_00005786 [Meloidogyne graminicola]|uniref:Uncharacterized protein n=1 Tax=Meloidogyne graminicola TaxID=189291 RepID=A0A8S9ZNG2_9BILA|nr:hypothetical protein Mgra_00005786 [Meloidogyne graminicola]
MIFTCFLNKTNYLYKKDSYLGNNNNIVVVVDYHNTNNNLDTVDMDVIVVVNVVNSVVSFPSFSSMRFRCAKHKINFNKKKKLQQLFENQENVLESWQISSGDSREDSKLKKLFQFIFLLPLALLSISSNNCAIFCSPSKLSLSSLLEIIPLILFSSVFIHQGFSTTDLYLKGIFLLINYLRVFASYGISVLLRAEITFYLILLFPPVLRHKTLKHNKKK